MQDRHLTNYYIKVPYPPKIFGLKIEKYMKQMST
jgi:hypothetical protein